MSTRFSTALSCLFALFLGTAAASAGDYLPGGENRGPVVRDGRPAPTVTYGQSSRQGGAYAAYGAETGRSSYYENHIPADPTIPRAYPGYKPYVPYNRDTYSPRG